MLQRCPSVTSHCALLPRNAWIWSWKTTSRQTPGPTSIQPNQVHVGQPLEGRMWWRDTRLSPWHSLKNRHLLHLQGVQARRWGGWRGYTRGESWWRHWWGVQITLRLTLLWWLPHGNPREHSVQCRWGTRGSWVLRIEAKFIPFRQMLYLAEAARMPMSTPQCLAADANFIINVLGKGVGPLSGTPLTRFHEYTSKRSRNNGTISGTHSEIITAPFCLPARHAACFEVTALTDKGYQMQMMAANHFRRFIPTGPRFVTIAATKTLALLRFARRAHLGALVEEVIPKVPAVLEHPAARAPMERIAAALALSARGTDVSLFSLSGFLGIDGHALTETKQLGALGRGI